jgi:hypothetical protein
MIITASFSFEAESLEEGEKIVSTWVVTPGVSLNGVQGTTVTHLAVPVQVGPTGSVGTALAVRKSRFVSAPQPPAPVNGVPPAVPFVQPPREKA